MSLLPIPAVKVQYLEAIENYTLIHSCEKPKLICRTLKLFQEELANKSQFIRIHRKYLINNQYIEDKSLKDITMTNGAVLPISRRRRSFVRKMID